MIIVENIIFLLTCILIVYSGFTLVFYGTYAKSMIDKISYKTYSKGMNIISEENRHFYAMEFEKWRTGSLFSSSTIRFMGFVVIIVICLVNLRTNKWWTTIILLVFGYFLSFIIAILLKWRTQIISIITLLICGILVIIQLVLL